MQLKFSFPADRTDTFENMAVDHHNEQAVLALKAFAEGAKGQPPSLVVFGPAGCGKTHALAAIGEAMRKKFAGRSAFYLDANELLDKLASSERYEDLKNYLRSYEKAAFLAVDNLDAARQNPEAQDQVFHLYNAVTQGGGRFAAALRTPPAEWRFSEWLTTRLLWGQVVELKPVGDEMRVLALRKMAADLRLHLPEHTAKWLISRLPRDPETQRKALASIDRLSLTTGRKVSIPLMKQALERFNAG